MALTKSTMRDFSSYFSCHIRRVQKWMRWYFSGNIELETPRQTSYIYTRYGGIGVLVLMMTVLPLLPIPFNEKTKENGSIMYRSNMQVVYPREMLQKKKKNFPT